MTKINQVYRCNVCGNMTEVVHTGVGQLVCCGQPMELLVEKKEDVGTEKHLPIREGNIVKIGSVLHPMEETHYIEWIEVIGPSETFKKFLSPTGDPMAEFEEIKDGSVLRAYCNVHGLWST